jgi:hypothetical protein
VKKAIFSALLLVRAITQAAAASETYSGPREQSAGDLARVTSELGGNNMGEIMRAELLATLNGEHQPQTDSFCSAYLTRRRLLWSPAQAFGESDTYARR